AQQAEVIWIGESEQIPSHVVIARPDLDSRVAERFTEVMMSLNQPENREYLAYLYGPDGYVLADDAAYDGVRAMARTYGLLR
ncbi:MAG: PhnD/SsuA/transferrin family substrate-binding protein, partial [Halocynthiibacter sp.]